MALSNAERQKRYREKMRNVTDRNGDEALEYFDEAFGWDRGSSLAAYQKARDGYEPEVKTQRGRRSAGRA